MTDITHHQPNKQERRKMKQQNTKRIDRRYERLDYITEVAERLREEIETLFEGGFIEELERRIRKERPAVFADDKPLTAREFGLVVVEAFSQVQGDILESILCP
jgi:hypothetical protein